MPKKTESINKILRDIDFLKKRIDALDRFRGIVVDEKIITADNINWNPMSPVDVMEALRNPYPNERKKKKKN